MPIAPSCACGTPARLCALQNQLASDGPQVPGKEPKGTGRSYCTIDTLALDDAVASTLLLACCGACCGRHLVPCTAAGEVS